MEEVINGGTGKRAGVPGYRMAGKTGTAQKAVASGGYSETEYMASFGGFGPAHSPRLVSLVVLDSPRGDWHQGGQVAAPVFSRIMADALHWLRVPHDLPPPPRTRGLETARSRETALHNAALARPLSPGRVPDLRGLGLREAVSRLAAHGYRAEANGTGSVVAQHPAAGARLSAGQACRIRLADRSVR